MTDSSFRNRHQLLGISTWRLGVGEEVWDVEHSKCGLAGADKIWIVKTLIIN